MRLLSLLFLVLFIAALGLFAYENNRSVEIALLKFHWEMALPILMLVVYLLGMCSGWFVVGLLKRSWQRVSEPDRKA